MAGLRKYHDGCPVALGMDVLGERWALLIVRELLLGPKRFGDLRAGLPGASADMVAVRLRELDAHGVVRRRRLPAPASAWVYELTEWGAELESLVIALARWSLRSPELAERASQPISVDSAVLALPVLFDPAAAAGVELTVALRLGEQAFRVTVADGVLDVVREEAPGADLDVRTDPATLTGLLRGARTVEDEVRAGRMAVVGETRGVLAFLGLFARSAEDPQDQPASTK